VKWAHRERAAYLDSSPLGRWRGEVGYPAEKIVMAEVKTLAEWMSERGLGLAEMIATSGLDARVVEAIAQCRYTPSPQQRQRISASLGIAAEQIAWGHQAAVDHVYGHGPQFGRSP
jgi:hypothetical protein